MTSGMWRVTEGYVGCLRGSEVAGARGRERAPDEWWGV